MLMAMMRIRHMSMRVPVWYVDVPVTVRAVWDIRVDVVVMPVIMAMRVFVLKLLMEMLMRVRLGQMQNHA